MLISVLQTQVQEIFSISTHIYPLEHVYNITGCALPSARAQPLFSHIYLIIIFAPLSIRQYLDYIENIGVKSFVLVRIELIVFLLVVGRYRR